MDRAYSGSTLIWEKSNDYLTLTVVSSGQIRMTANGRAIDISVNGGAFERVGSDVTRTFSTGDVLKFRGTVDSYYNNEFFEYDGVYLNAATVDVKGNIMSMIYGDDYNNAAKRYKFPTGSSRNFFYFFGGVYVRDASRLLLPATALTEGCYEELFAERGKLTAAPNLPATKLANRCYASLFGNSKITNAPELPATSLSAECYVNMFAHCPNLTTAPTLSATKLANYCYEQMFWGCTALTNVQSVLPATALTEGCYNRMYADCRSLEYPPELPAATLKTNCYAGMFAITQTGAVDEGKLKRIKCLATNISASGCTNNWVFHAAQSTGTFIKASSMTGWTTGYSGIPSGWTVQNA